MPVKIFFCYAHEDEELLDKLKATGPLKRQGIIDVWHDREYYAQEQNGNRRSKASEHRPR